MEGDHEQDNQQGNHSLNVAADGAAPQDAGGREKLDGIVLKLKDSSIFWYKKRYLMTERDDNGMCPVHLAAKMGYTDLIQEFMQLVPNCINIRNRDHKSALHVAVENHQLEVVKELLREKETMEFLQMVSQDYDKAGDNSLHLAAKNAGDPQIVRELLKWPGARVNAVNNLGLTAFDIAAYLSELGFETHVRTNSVEIKKILEAAGCCRGQLETKESNVLQVYTVVASLIATITFAAIFQIPGGIEDNKNSVHHGAARLAFNTTFQCFLLSDILGFSASMAVIMAWLFGERLQKQLYKARSLVVYLSQFALIVAIYATIIAFLCATFLVIIPPNVHALLTKHKKEYEAYVHIWRRVTVVTIMPTCVVTDFVVYVVLSGPLWVRGPVKGLVVHVLLFVPLWLRRLVRELVTRLVTVLKLELPTTFLLTLFPWIFAFLLILSYTAL